MEIAFDAAAPDALDQLYRDFIAAQGRAGFLRHPGCRNGANRGARFGRAPVRIRGRLFLARAQNGG